MQAAVPQGVGAMAAILGGDDAQIAQVCTEVANGQVVAPPTTTRPVNSSSPAILKRSIARSRAWPNWVCAKP